MWQDGSSALADPVSVRWSRDRSSGPPILQIPMDSGQGTHIQLGAGANAGWRRLGMGQGPRFGVEELPAERVGYGPITACPCTLVPLKVALGQS